MVILLLFSPSLGVMVASNNAPTAQAITSSLRQYVRLSSLISYGVAL